MCIDTRGMTRFSFGLSLFEYSSFLKQVALKIYIPWQMNIVKYVCVKCNKLNINH